MLAKTRVKNTRKLTVLNTVALFTRKKSEGLLVTNVAACTPRDLVAPWVSKQI